MLSISVWVDEYEYIDGNRERLVLQSEDGKREIRLYTGLTTYKQIETIDRLIEELQKMRAEALIKAAREAVAP